MRLPDFVAIAKKYAPVIAIENKHHLDLVRAGRWISFDLRTADGLDYINGVGQAIKPVYDELQSAKGRYDDDIKASIVVSNPSRIALYKVLVGTIRDDVLNAQLSEVDCYELLCYIYDNGNWPNYHWDAVCPELAAAAKRLRKEQDEKNAPVLDPAILRGEPTQVERLAELMQDVSIRELVGIYKVEHLIAFIEGRLSINEEDELLQDLWSRVSRDLAQAVVMKRWAMLHLRNELKAILPDAFTQYMNSLEAVDAYMVIRGNIEHDFGNDALTAAVDTAKTIYLAKKKQTKTNGEEKMNNAPKIEYHSRLQCTAGNLSGTITLSINGELAIVDVTCQKDVQKVSYNWVTLPKRGYDTAVQSMVCWFNGNAAAAIIGVVYPDGGMPKTIAVTLNI